MTDGLQSFVNNIGLMCETWSLAYSKFIQMGFDHPAAMEHTKEFMSIFLSSAAQHNGEKDG